MARTLRGKLAIVSSTWWWRAWIQERAWAVWMFPCPIWSTVTVFGFRVGADTR